MSVLGFGQGYLEPRLRTRRTYSGQIRSLVPATTSGEIGGGVGRDFRLLEGMREGLGVECFFFGDDEYG